MKCERKREKVHVIDDGKEAEGHAGARVMGACLGRCFANATDPSAVRSYRSHSGMGFGDDDRIEFSRYVDEDEDRESIERPKSLLSFLSLKRFKKKRHVPISLELAEDSGWAASGSKYARLHAKCGTSVSSGLDTSLRTLDARSLMKQGCVATPPSSLDLEWEHEGLTMPAANDQQQDTSDVSLSYPTANNSQPSSLTASPWSRVSTPNSLEWDPVEADIECVDVETEQLITEIERLTDRALKETGDWRSSS